jgi:hypothetical protein
MRSLLQKFALLGILIGIGFVFTIHKPISSGTVLKPELPSGTPQVAGVTDSLGVPEMVDILSSDQEKRLKAARHLAERVGVEEALEILEKSTLPHTGEGHLVVHQIGFYAYEKYGPDAILHCKDYFLFACYHGAIIEAAGDLGVTGIAKMTDTCKTSGSRYFQCVHAAGHAILAMFNYDLPKALSTCDELYEKETKFPEALSSCHNGAFMENLFGVHDWGKGKTPVRQWLKDNEPYYPCTAFGEKYQKGCWLNQAARIYQMYLGDIEKSARACEGTGNRQYTDWCFDNLARQLHPLSNGDTSKVFPLCAKLGNYWMEGCVIVNASSYYSVGDPQAGFRLCAMLSGPAQNSCFEKILGQIVGDTISFDQKTSLCGQLPEMYKKPCVDQLKNPT